MFLKSLVFYSVLISWPVFSYVGEILDMKFFVWNKSEVSNPIILHLLLPTKKSLWEEFVRTWSISVAALSLVLVVDMIFCSKNCEKENDIVIREGISW